jgi:hypothetical protein
MPNMPTISRQISYLYPVIAGIFDDIVMSGNFIEFASLFVKSKP